MSEIPDRHITGDWFDNCSRAVPCPCTYSGGRADDGSHPICFLTRQRSLSNLLVGGNSLIIPAVGVCALPLKQRVSMMNQPNPAVASEEIFQQAVAVHEQGKLDQAEQLYRTILSGDRVTSARCTISGYFVFSGVTTTARWHLRAKSCASGQIWRRLITSWRLRSNISAG